MKLYGIKQERWNNLLACEKQVARHVGYILTVRHIVERIHGLERDPRLALYNKPRPHTPRDGIGQDQNLQKLLSALVGAWNYTEPV